MRLHQTARELLPHALGRKLGELARRGELAHQRKRLPRDLESESRGEARDAQHAQRILGEGRRHVPQYPRAQIGLAAERIDELSLLVARHRVDREIPARQILVERYIGRDEELEAAIAVAVLALGARERVFLARVRVQEHREIASHRLVARRNQNFGRRADDHPVAVNDAAAEKLVPNRAADAIDLHRRG